MLLSFLSETGRRKAMRQESDEKRVEDMMKRPIPKKRIGIVRLQMVKERRTLYGMRRFVSAEEAVEMVRPLVEMADREMVLVLSLNNRLEPMAMEIAAVGGMTACHVEVGSVFKHALLNNAPYVMCFHNHPSGDPTPSLEDKRLTSRLKQCGDIVGIKLVDHIIIGADGYYSSFRDDWGVRDSNGEEVHV